MIYDLRYAIFDVRFFFKAKVKSEKANNLSPGWGGTTAVDAVRRGVKYNQGMDGFWNCKIGSKFIREFYNPDAIQSPMQNNRDRRDYTVLRRVSDGAIATSRSPGSF